MPGSSPMQPQGPSPVPSYQGASPGQLAQPSPGGMMSNSMNPSPSSNLNTPLGSNYDLNNDLEHLIIANITAAAPASQEDREYFEKVKSLEKYIEPLRNMIAKIGDGDQDRLIKMKKLLDILSNPSRRMNISTLLKCEDVLKRMNLETVEPDSSKEGNPLLEAVMKIRQTSGHCSAQSFPLQHIHVSLSNTPGLTNISATPAPLS